MDECYKLLDMVYTLIWPQDGSETQKMKFEFSKVNVNLFSENMDHKIELKLEKKKKNSWVLDKGLPCLQAWNAPWVDGWAVVGSSL